jgi:CDP-diacylglycerol pyrophosphatase
MFAAKRTMSMKRVDRTRKGGGNRRQPMKVQTVPFPHPIIAVAAGMALFISSTVRADPLTLWKIVHDECVVHQKAGEKPAPCESVVSTGGEQGGVAILKDLVGASQMLAIPTQRITGIEDPQLLAPDAPDMFGEAWKGRVFVESRLQHTLPREDVGIAVNAEWKRSQYQLHLHVDCLAKNVADALADYSSKLDTNWRKMPFGLNGRVYLARRLDSADLTDVRPFLLLADGIEGARQNMKSYTLAAVGAIFDGKPGFILLADRLDSDGGGEAEDLEDHGCAIVLQSPP